MTNKPINRFACFWKDGRVTVELVDSLSNGAPRQKMVMYRAFMPKRGLITGQTYRIEDEDEDLSTEEAVDRLIFVRERLLIGGQTYFIYREK